MEENHPIEELMVTAMNSIKEMIDANTIIGEPIKALNNTVIIPISKLGFGFAAGGSEFNDETVNSYVDDTPFGGGSGAGVNITPVAFLIVQNDNVKLLEASHSSVLDKLVEYIPDTIDKINGIIKRKMDRADGNLGYVGEDDDFDDDLDEELDDEWEDFDDEPIVKEEKVSKKIEKKIKDNKKENKE